jgi:hypothetical protein
MNAAVDFDDAYSFEGGDIYRAAASGLGLLAGT